MVYLTAMSKRDNYNTYMNEYMKTRYWQRRKRTLSKLGGACRCCGSKEKLEIDHIDPTTKAFPLNKLWSVSERRFDEELAKCQLLCRSCHIEKTRKDPDTYPATTHLCCGRTWIGRQYAGHRRHHASLV